MYICIEPVESLADSSVECFELRHFRCKVPHPVCDRITILTHSSGEWHNRSSAMTRLYMYIDVAFQAAKMHFVLSLFYVVVKNIDRCT